VHWIEFLKALLGTPKDESLSVDFYFEIPNLQNQFNHCSLLVSQHNLRMQWRKWSWWSW